MCATDGRILIALPFNTKYKDSMDILGINNQICYNAGPQLLADVQLKKSQGESLYELSEQTDKAKTNISVVLNAEYDEVGSVSIDRMIKLLKLLKKSQEYRRRHSPLKISKDKQTDSLKFELGSNGAVGVLSTIFKG